MGAATTTTARILRDWSIINLCLMRGRTHAASHLDRQRAHIFSPAWDHNLVAVLFLNNSGNVFHPFPPSCLHTYQTLWRLVGARIRGYRLNNKLGRLMRCGLRRWKREGRQFRRAGTTFSFSKFIKECVRSLYGLACSLGVLIQLFMVEHAHHPWIFS